MRIAAIGLGGLGSATLDGLSVLDDVTVVAGADIAAEPRRTFEDRFDAPSYDDPETMLDAHRAELDAATVATPHALHTEHVMACLERDLHVHVEKPLTVGVENAAKLVDAAAERDLVLQVGYQRHFHPGFREVKRLLDSGRIGDIHMVTAFLAQDWTGAVEGWRGDADVSGGGQLYDSGSHLLDALLWLTDTRARSVSAVIDDRGQDVDINTGIAATLETESGGTVTANVGVSGDGSLFEEGFYIWGTSGHVEYETGTITVDEADGETYTAEAEVPGDDPDFEILMRRKLGAFADAVTADEVPPVTGEQGLQVIAMTEAAYESYQSGRRVDAQKLIADARGKEPPLRRRD